MNSDPKATSRRSGAAAQATQAVEKLLERITRAAEADSTEATPQLTSELTALIERVREQYRILADRQLRAALEAAIALEASKDDPPSNSVKEQYGHDDALEALEALIHGWSEPSSVIGDDTPEHNGEHKDAPSAVDQDPNKPELFEGTVRLHVYPGGSMQRVLRFIEDIGKRPQFRVLRMSGNPQREGAEIDLGLREPTPLLATLRDMGHTAEPNATRAGGIQVITVHLNAAEVASQSR